MFEGRLVAEFSAEEADERRIGLAMAGSVAALDDRAAAETRSGELHSNSPGESDSRWPRHDPSNRLRTNRPAQTDPAQTASKTSAQTPSESDGAAPTLRALPAWVEIVAGPLFSLFFALLIAGVTISLVGENPFAVFAALARGSQVIINYSDVGLDAANVCRYETSYALRPLSNTLYFTSSLIHRPCGGGRFSCGAL